MVKLWSWKSVHCPSLFPLVSTPLISGSDRRSLACNSPPSMHRTRLGRVSHVTSAFRGIPGLKMVARGCGKCRGKGHIECPGCKGTGKNKKNGNVFERWKCYDCQGFGLLSCPTCGKGGLTPEQRGERFSTSLDRACPLVHQLMFALLDINYKGRVVEELGLS